MTIGLSFRKAFSPIPLMFISSSTFLKPPFFCLCSTISCAVRAPIPGSFSSCAAVAVFKLIGLATADDSLPFAVFSCATIACGIDTNVARTNASTNNRRMCFLLSCEPSFARNWSGRTVAVDIDVPLNRAPRK